MKKASQIDETAGYSRSYPASRAVDGNTNPVISKSCAHPYTRNEDKTAWWKVDLNDTYRLYSVVIYNRDCCAQRLDGFTLSVGNRPQSDQLVRCGTHTGRVAISASVTTSCKAVGRYLEFRRTITSSEPNFANFCEVVVIGHLYINCSLCPSSSGCNDVTGCDACGPGKQQPDCKKQCDDKTYGVNCETPCGHCRNSSPCDVVNGRCSNGCEDWYSLDDNCNTFIPIPDFETSAKTKVDVINSSAVVVSWSKATNIPSAVEDHYYYVVWLQVDEGTRVNVTQIQHDVHSNRFESYITGLVYNTHYSVWVEAFRQQDKNHEGGTHTDDAIFKTDCIEKGKTSTWGSFKIESISEQKFADYVIREFSLKNEALKKMRRMRQFHFTGWPDLGTPEFAYPLLAFHRKVHSFDSERRGPLVVHCSAGVGRTGTFIAIDILTEQAKAEGKVDVFHCVSLLRTQRMNMVQTLEQYIFVYQALLELNEVAIIACSELKQTFDELCKSSKLAEQFERLNALKPVRKNVKCAALEPKNVSKNRVIKIIPDDRHRPHLSTPWTEGNDYINAVFVHGYKERNAYIITQSPMTATVVDLWRLLNDHESRTVVMLDHSDVTDDECASYCPSQTDVKCKYGPFEVELVDTVSTKNAKVTVRELKFSKSNRSGDSGTVIKQFQLNNSWSRDSPLPSNATVLVDLLDAVEKWQQQNGNGPIVIHCTDGASRSGLVCAASYLLEHMKVEQEVDVFHAVQHIRTTRPQLITHLVSGRH
ncbi:hypothetical protein NP493_48g07132 [Ridgeia piscesae]|uniref:protein-tyrosine-phosphatase n=1 Tax=Ridgeia piscesae TaxID=27915 RepID=A0AAD9PBE9_RIDPI|nr:hypothetical protein NP493_48g07132 [Ridgeia piscesae]